jgi:RNA polymerase sigma factor (sigma-70 family)
MNTNQQLLERYVRQRDEDAFRKLVEGFFGLVKSTALRRVNGDSARALDIVQMVFTDLAREAGRLKADVLLGGWLYQHTCFVAAKVMRGEQRRNAREKEAMEMSLDHSEASWAQLAPLLDEAILELRGPDRSAIILRFLENQDLNAVGRALGVSPDAAQKRVQRALEKLRGIFQAREIAVFRNRPRVDSSDECLFHRGWKCEQNDCTNCFGERRNQNDTLGFPA